MTCLAFIKPHTFRAAQKDGELWVRRVRALRCNASCKSHAELDCAPELDPGDPMDFGQLHHKMRIDFPWISVIGGCCGTNEKHLEEVCKNIMGRK